MTSERMILALLIGVVLGVWLHAWWVSYDTKLDHHVDIAHSLGRAGEIRIEIDKETDMSTLWIRDEDGRYIKLDEGLFVPGRLAGQRFYWDTEDNVLTPLGNSDIAIKR